MAKPAGPVRRFLASRIVQRAREVVRGGPVAPIGDDVYSAWTTLYGTPDIERLLPTYEEYSRNAYSGNAVVFGLSIRRLMLFTEAGICLRDRKDKSLSADDPVLDTFRTPWPNGQLADLLARMIQDADLAGNAYVRDAGDRLERLRPDWVTIISKLELDPFGREVRTVLGYMYEPLLDTGRKTEFYDVGEVAHWAPIPDPTANFRGMTWITPVIREINADIAMSEHSYNYFRNAATPNLIIKYSTELRKGGIEKVRDQIAARHTGSDNAFSTLVLDRGADPIIVGSKITDVGFGNIQAAGENRIAVAAGVPAIVAGLKEGLQAATLANFHEAMELFANLTMRPLWRSAMAALAILVDIPEGKELWYDTRDIAALQQGEQSLAETMQTNASTVSTLISAGYTPESVVKAVTAGDLTLLEHTGLYSVQLRPPGSTDPAAGANAPGGSADPDGDGDVDNGDPALDTDKQQDQGTEPVKRTAPDGSVWVWDEIARMWRPELHPRDHHGRFRGIDAHDVIAGNPDLSQISHRHLHTLFARVTDHLDAGHINEATHHAAATKLFHEMTRREELAAARKIDPLHGRKLSEMSDRELAQIVHDHPRRTDVRRKVDAEMQWRETDRKAGSERAAWHANWSAHGSDHLEQHKIDQAVGAGHSYGTAYGKAYAITDPGELAAAQRAALVDVERRGGETKRQAVRRAYGEHVHLAYLAAEKATRGNILNREGTAKGIDPLSLFSGPVARARKYASEELLRHWGETGTRKTYGEFLAETLTGDASVLAAAKTRGNGSEHGV